MGVYNPNMKMPENCYLCGYSVCGCVTSNMILHCGVAEPMDFMEAQEHRHKDCPLVEVKAPHGRLADVSENATYDARYDHFDDHQMIVAQRMLDDLPTIIEAEGKDDG